ncbi:hypothetical protein ACIA5H_37100 [Nocardia sp. NPDC051900]|uniref:hypothetical protein n=1 Tax=Nocardia sp. NPDC051900 TaxID=3364326 RepID=UPI00378A25E6
MTDTAREQTPLQAALVEACEFAKRHGVTDSITPADFGIQRSEPGITHATYVSGEHVVSVTIGGGGTISFAVAELFWVHDEADENRDACPDCGECIHCGETQCECVPPGRPMVDVYLPGRPMVDVYLPGDAPAEVDHCPPAVLGDSDPVARDFADVDPEEPEWMLYPPGDAPAEVNAHG